ncbi:hypothetical protein BKA65DRAFT_53694 [Rhexocercosporidium sp. MPI-PUGE-AT-0058]|nr:hypothetical protein BKA65DRAFT_53694 [Rhexocercosporidium sp. MPI-PUGE-AT-0058]
MGGIPGTSKGCITCRRRKIRCDYKRPKCIRCSKSRYECEGYGTRTVYMHRHAGSMDISDRENITRAKRVSKETTLPVAATHFSRAETDLCSRTRDATLQHALWREFVEHCGPNWGSWDWTCHSRTADRVLLNQALFAASAAYIGHRRSDQVMVSQSQVAYSVALQRMRQSLVAFDTLKKDVLLGVCMAFQAYEMFQCTSGSIKSWATHIGGAMSVFKSENLLPRDGTKALTCFKIIKRMAVILALISRKSTINPRVHIPMPQNTLSENLLLSLQDSQTAYMCELARILSTIDAAASSKSVTRQDRRDEKSRKLQQDCVKLGYEMYAWHGQLQDLEGSNIIIVEATKPLECMSFQTRIMFRSPQMAHLHMHYWCAMLLLCDAMSRFREQLFIPRQPWEIEPSILATMICQSLDYLRTSSAMEGSRHVLYPLWVVSNYYSKTGGCEWTWCGDFGRKLKKNGLLIAECLVRRDPWDGNASTTVEVCV